MTEPLVDALARLAPEVDVQAADDVFTRRRSSPEAPDRSSRIPLVAAAALLVVGLVAALIVVVRNTSSSGPVTSVETTPPTSLEPPSTTAAPAVITTPSTTVATTVPQTVPPTTVAPVFGEVAPIADATIFYLPDPLPAGWIVTGVIANFDLPEDDPNASGDLEAVPPVLDGTWHEYLVWLVKSDGTAIAHVSVTEYPAPPPVAPYEFPGVEAVDVGGLPHYHVVVPAEDDPISGVPGLATSDSWGWVQDGRSMSLEVVGSSADAEMLVGSMRRVSGAQLGTTIADGQRAMLELPELASAQVDGGPRLTARGAGDTVLAVCAESAISTCGSIGLYYGRLGVAMTMAATSAGPQEVAWLPTALAQPLAPGPIVLDGGRLGSFAYDFAELSTFGVDPASGFDMFSAIGSPRRDLLGMPNLDGNLPE